MQYLSVLDVIAINDQIMLLVQRNPRVLDESLLAGALMRPQMAAYYESAALVTQAALLIQGIALAHSFVDGNKRTSLIAGAAFLDLNGYYLASLSPEFGQQIERLVMRAITLDAFVAWLQARLQPNP